jgi:hypothetical protein
MARTSKVVLRKSQLFLTSTTMHEGEEFSVNMSVTTSTIVKDFYVKKHITYKGEITMSFPGTDEPDDVGPPGTVFPGRDTYKVHNYQFKAKATAQGTSSTYYCVIPTFASDRLSQEDLILNPGDTITINTGTVAFAFGSSFMVNGVISTTAEAVLACENNPATLTAQDTSCRVVKMAVLK